jgi:starvation-inducible DNA-binding protein
MNAKTRKRNSKSNASFHYDPGQARPHLGQKAAEIQAFGTIAKLLTAHAIVLQGARASAKKAAELDDDGTNDLLVSDVIRTNEMQVWFLAEHVVDTPQVIAD